MTTQDLPDFHDACDGEADADSSLAGIERGFQAAAEIADESLAIRGQMTALHRWGRAAPEQAIAFSNILAQRARELPDWGHMACVAIGQALLGAFDALAAPRPFSFGCEWTACHDEDSGEELDDELRATFHFQADALPTAAGGSLSPEAMVAWRDFALAVSHDWKRQASADRVQGEDILWALAHAYESQLHLRAAESPHFDLQADLPSIHAALDAIRAVRERAALRSSIPAAAASGAPRI